MRAVRRRPRPSRRVRPNPDPAAAVEIHLLAAAFSMISEDDPQRRQGRWRDTRGLRARAAGCVALQGLGALGLADDPDLARPAAMLAAGAPVVAARRAWGAIKRGVAAAAAGDARLAAAGWLVQGATEIDGILAPPGLAAVVDVLTGGDARRSREAAHALAVGCVDEAFCVRWSCGPDENWWLRRALLLFGWDERALAAARDALLDEVRRRVDPADRDVFDDARRGDPRFATLRQMDLAEERRAISQAGARGPGDTERLSENYGREQALTALASFARQNSVADQVAEAHSVLLGLLIRGPAGAAPFGAEARADAALLAALPCPRPSDAIANESAGRGGLSVVAQRLDMLGYFRPDGYRPRRTRRR